MGNEVYFRDLPERLWWMFSSALVGELDTQCLMQMEGWSRPQVHGYRVIGTGEVHRVEYISTGE